MLKDHDPDMDVKVFYIDMRAFGKGFEDLFRRSKGMGVRYIRGLPGSIQEDPKTKDLILTVENTATNQLEKHRAEMVVLAVGVKPPADMKGDPGDAGPSKELGRILPGGPPQAPARGFGHAGHFLCGLRRRTQGHQGFRHPGLCSGSPGHAPDESEAIARGGDHCRGRSGRLHVLRDVRQGVPVQGDQRGYKGEDPGAESPWRLVRAAAPARPNALQTPS